MRLFVGCIISVFILAACAPTRYPPGYHGSQPSTNTQHLGEGGKVKRGNPYQIDGTWYEPLATGEAYDEVGIASWYGKKFHGKTTANGETYNMYDMTAAHTVLPMPSIVKVTNLENGKSIRVRINDRGPFVKGRLIDLSYAAAKALGYAKQGTAKVRVQTLYSADVSAEQVTTRPPAQAIANANTPKPTPTKESHLITATTTPQAELAYVQVGAFSSKQRAVEVAQQLKTKAAHASAEVTPAGKVFRVRLGPFDLDVDAAQVLESVKNSGYTAAMIIHDH
jgi:rare lipoprotein A